MVKLCNFVINFVINKKKNHNQKQVIYIVGLQKSLYCWVCLYCFCVCFAILLVTNCQQSTNQRINQNNQTCAANDIACLVEDSFGDQFQWNDITPPLVTSFPSGGVFFDKQTVAFLTNEDAVVYYTVDGNQPTEESLVANNNKVNIKETTTIRYFAKDAHNNSSPIYMSVYTKGSKKNNAHKLIETSIQSQYNFATNPNTFLTKKDKGINVHLHANISSFTMLVNAEKLALPQNPTRNPIKNIFYIDGNNFQQGWNVLSLRNQNHFATYNIYRDDQHSFTLPNYKAGLYNRSIAIQFFTTEYNQIYYTTNGSTPTIQSSIYKQPIILHKDTNLQFFSIDYAGNIEPTKQFMYTFDYGPPKITINQSFHNQFVVSSDTSKHTFYLEFQCNEPIEYYLQINTSKNPTKKITQGFYNTSNTKQYISITKEMLAEGMNAIKLVGKDKANNTASKTIHLGKDTVAEVPNPIKPFFNEYSSGLHTQLYWSNMSSSNHASLYVLEVATTQDFQQVYHKAQTQSNTYKLTVKKPDAYYYRVKHIDYLKNVSGYSSTRKFHLGKVLHDINNDSYSDIAVGAYGYDIANNPNIHSGAVYVFLGGNTEHKNESKNKQDSSKEKENFSENYDIKILSNNKNEFFGKFVQFINDINGDGIPELSISALQNSEKFYQAGKVVIFYGGIFLNEKCNNSYPCKLYASNADVHLYGEKSGDSFGHTVISVNKIGSAYNSLFISSINADNNALLDTGKIYQYTTGKAYTTDKEDTTIQPHFTIDGSVEYAQMGYSIITTDINNDGKIELVASEPYFSNENFFYSGKISIYKQKWQNIKELQEVDNKKNFQLSSSITASDFSNIGKSISSIDLDIDGYSDIIVSAYPSLVYLFLGKTIHEKSIIHYPNEVLYGSQSSNFGFSISSISHIDDRYHPTFILCDPNFSTEILLQAGRCSLYQWNSSAQASVVANQITGSEPASNFGYSTKYIGDINKDGYHDFAISANRKNIDKYNNVGCVYVFLGNSSFLKQVYRNDSSADYILCGENQYDFFGESVSGL